MTNESSSSRSERQTDAGAWKDIVARYQTPALGRSLLQISNTVIPYVALWYLMYLSLAVSWWLTVPLAILAGGFMVRLFIIFHDCGHGSFFKSRQANDVWGIITGVLTLTPYYHWRWEHARHHSTSGDLDRRGMGDIWTLTVQEYLDASRGKRITYRLARNPVVLFLLAPLFLFLVKHRLPTAGASPRERRSVYWTNLAVLGMAVALGWAFGLQAYLLIHLTVIMVAGSAGVWLFYVQHQFEGFTGNAARHGTTPRLRCAAVRITNCPGSCNGSPATSGFITCIISARGFPTIIWRSATRRIRCFSACRP